MEPLVEITLENAKDIMEVKNPVIRRRIYNPKNKDNKYILESNLLIRLSNGDVLFIRKGFKWDLSSVPRLLWPILPPDGDFELASTIHDMLYRTKKYDRYFSDNEMLAWSNAVNNNKWYNFVDNRVRYIFVRMLGWITWNNR